MISREGTGELKMIEAAAMFAANGTTVERIFNASEAGAASYKTFRMGYTRRSFLQSGKDGRTLRAIAFNFAAHPTELMIGLKRFYLARSGSRGF